MNVGEDEPEPTVFDSAADCVSTAIFGPLGPCCNAPHHTVDEENDDEEAKIRIVSARSLLLDDVETIEGAGKQYVDGATDAHIIQSTLARIANGPRSSTISQEENSQTSENNIDSGPASLDVTLEKQLVTLLDFLDPSPVDGVVEEAGKEISVESFVEKDHALPAEDGNDKPTLDLVSADVGQTEKSEEQAHANPPVDVTSPPCLEQATETTAPVFESSFAACICPFVSTSSDAAAQNVANETHDHNLSEDTFRGEAEIKKIPEEETTDKLDTAQVTIQKSVTIDGADADSTPDEENKSGAIEELEPTPNELPVTDQVATGKKETSSFSFLSYVIPLSTHKSEGINKAVANAEQDLDLEASNMKANKEDSKVFAAELTEEVVPLPEKMNPPAKWSMFSPFITSFLDSHRSTLAKDPSGEQMKEEEDPEVKEVLNNDGLDPIGLGPSLASNSVDKTTTPPWSREDPPPTKEEATRDIETPDVCISPITEALSRDLETSNHSVDTIAVSDDVEWSVTGPIKKTQDDVVASAKPLTTSKSDGQDQMLHKGQPPFLHRRRCSCIFLFLFLIIAALSVGSYFIVQSNNSTSRTVSAASSSEQSEPVQVPMNLISSSPSALRATSGPSSSPSASPALAISPSLSPSSNPSLGTSAAPSLSTSAAPSTFQAIATTDDSPNDDGANDDGADDDGADDDGADDDGADDDGADDDGVVATDDGGVTINSASPKNDNT
jgi:hypothetical protein